MVVWRNFRRRWGRRKRAHDGDRAPPPPSASRVCCRIVSSSTDDVARDASCTLSSPSSVLSDLAMRVGLCADLAELSHVLFSAAGRACRTDAELDVECPLVALACIWIVLKYEEDCVSRYTSGAEHLIQFLEGSHHYDRLLDVEALVLRAIDWNVYACIESHRTRRLGSERCMG